MGAATSKPVNVGIFGGSGYSGRELRHWLGRHPRATVSFSTGSAKPHIPHEEGLSRPADVHFLCLPHGTSASYAHKLRTQQPDSLVVDLSGDLRLKTGESYQRW